MDATTGSRARDGLRLGLITVSFATTLYTLVALIAFTIVAMEWAPHGSLGLGLGPCDAERFCAVRGVDAGKAAARGGLRVGDQIRFRRSSDAIRYSQLWFAPGDRVPVEVRRQGAAYPAVLSATPHPWTDGNPALTTSDNMLSLTSALTVLVGAFVVFRARRRLSVLLLGAGMALSQAEVATVPYWFWGDEVIMRVFNAAGDLLQAASPVLFAAFALAFRRETELTPAPGRKVDAWLLWALAAATAGWNLIAEVLVQSDQLRQAWVNIPYGLTPGSWGTPALADAAYGLSIAILVGGWRAAPAREKTRYGYVVPAMVLILIGQSLGFLPSVFGGWNPQNPIVIALNVLQPLGLGLLIYAVLRHRVIDVGFALNRTLVYSLVSAVLLAAFGLTEWAVDHLVPVVGREKNALVDAAIALGVYLTFHRVRDGVERGVEALFFRRWQEAEAGLRRFVREAAFVTTPGALGDAFLDALNRFTGGAACALYVDDRAGYALSAGRVEAAPALLDRDLPAMVRLRADLRAHEASDGPLAGCLIAPMVNRNLVTGLAVIAPRASGAHWRPDEIELIGWATRQVGLDLHALRIEQLEAANADLGHRLEALQGVLALKRA